MTLIKHQGVIFREIEGNLKKGSGENQPKRNRNTGGKFVVGKIKTIGKGPRKVEKSGLKRT